MRTNECVKLTLLTIPSAHGFSGRPTQNVRLLRSPIPNTRVKDQHNKHQLAKTGKVLWGGTSCSRYSTAAYKNSNHSLRTKCKWTWQTTCKWSDLISTLLYNFIHTFHLSPIIFIQISSLEWNTLALAYLLCIEIFIILWIMFLMAVQTTRHDTFLSIVLRENCFSISLSSR
jgi:hypothetical protein